MKLRLRKVLGFAKAIGPVGGQRSPLLPLTLKSCQPPTFAQIALLYQIQLEVLAVSLTGPTQQGALGNC